MTEYIYHSDGSNSHPKGQGPAGAAFMINGRDAHYFPMETGTNNDSEFRGLVEAIEHFAVVHQPGDSAIFKSDSEYVVRTVAGWLNLVYHPVRYGLTSKSVKFRPLLERIALVWDNRKMSLYWIPREDNMLADKASKEACDRAKKLYG